jgi:uncharacterized protein YbjT (DUF2867 family)
VDPEPGQTGVDLFPDRTVKVASCDFPIFCPFQTKKERGRVTDRLPVLSLLIQAADVTDGRKPDDAQQQMRRGHTMKIVVLGGTGLIGSRVVRILKDQKHDVLAASAATIDLLTGRGLSEALRGAQVVIDLTNSPSFEDSAVLNFFETSARNLFPAEAAAGVRHHIALSIVGADRMTNVGYMRAKVAQENAIQSSGIPYTIVRATQFFEFIGSLADAGTQDGTVRLSNVLMQPIAADDIAGAVAKIALQAPKNCYINVAGPERRQLDELARELFKARDDPRQIVTDPSLGYFGGQVPENALVPDHDEILGKVRFSDWLAQSLTHSLAHSRTEALQAR